MSATWFTIAVLLLGAQMAGHSTHLPPTKVSAEPAVIVVPSAWSSARTKEFAVTVSDSLIKQLNRRREGQALSLIDAVGLAGLGPLPSIDCLVARQVATKLGVPRVLCPAVLIDTQLRPILEATLVDVPTGNAQVVGPFAATDPGSAVHRMVESVSALLPSPADDMQTGLVSVRR